MALVVGTLMLVAVVVLFGLADSGNRLYYGNAAARQKEAWLDAALMLYRQDSFFAEKTDESGSFLLFNDEPASEVTLKAGYWGLYELVTATCSDGKTKRAQLIGAGVPDESQAALYIPDNRRALTIAGKSDIRGDVRIPGKGIVYGQVKSDFYSGERLPEKRVGISEERLPAPYAPPVEEFDQMIRNVKIYSAPLDVNELSNSFTEPTLYVIADSLSGVTLTGNIIVSSDAAIKVGCTSVLEDVLLVAPKIFIGDGFSGSLQAFAADSLTVGRNVILKYPSGIAITAAGEYSHISVATGSEVNGYVICRKRETKTKRQNLPNYTQDEGVKVRGLVWIDGVAEIHGTVTGSLYATQPNYYAPQGFYINMLYNVRIYGSEAIAFPLWAGNHYPKKTVKWLY